MKVNMITGTIGAFIGVLIGVAAWVGIYLFGYIAGIAGAIMMFCAFKGFEILGRGINMPGIIICILLVLAAIYCSHNIAIAVSVMQERQGLSFVDAYKGIDTLKDLSKDFMEAYYKDLFVGYALSLLSIVPMVKNYIKGRNQEQGTEQ